MAATADIGRTFSNSEFYNNVSIDSSFAMLRQVNEITLEKIRWENNTFVHRADAIPRPSP